MHRTATLLIVVLTGASILAAQTTEKNRSQLKTIVISPPAIACPVGLRAKQAGGGDALEVNGARQKGIAQALHLIVDNFDARRVVSASVTVHGLSPKSRVTKLAASADEPDAAKTLNVSFARGEGREAWADVSVPGLSTVKSVDLNSVTYSDGSTWKLAPGSSCRVPIDAFMLIGER